MPSHKLTYFPIQGLAEPIRYLFHYGGIDFEDVEIKREDWPKIKPSMPFGQMPVLEIDGEMINQSVPIMRYVAKQVGLAGKDDWEALKIDAAAASIDDLRAKIASWHYETEPASKEAKYAPLFNETIPYFLERLDAQVKANGGYFVGGALSWADLSFSGMLTYLNFMTKFDITENYENLKQLNAKVRAVPRIKAWVERRPVTDR